MLDPNYGDDLIDFDLWSHTPLQPALSSARSWCKRTHATMTKNFAAFSPKDNRFSVTLGSICFLVGLQTLAALYSSRHTFNGSDQALHQLLVSELSNAQPGEAQVIASEPVIGLEALIQNEYVEDCGVLDRRG